MDSSTERIISLFNRERTTVWFEKQTGIDRYRWGNIKNGKARLSADEIDAICKIFPEYAYWITTGKTIPEAGQVSPEIEATAQSYQKQGKG